MELVNGFCSSFSLFFFLDMLRWHSLNSWNMGRYIQHKRNPIHIYFENKYNSCEWNWYIFIFEGWYGWKEKKRMPLTFEFENARRFCWTVADDAAVLLLLLLKMCNFLIYLLNINKIEFIRWTENGLSHSTTPLNGWSRSIFSCVCNVCLWSLCVFLVSLFVW